MFDIATLLVSFTAVELIMSVVLLLFTATGQKVKGIMELALALLIGSLGSVLAFLATNPPPNRFYLYTASLCFVVGVLLSARAMRHLQYFARRKLLETLCLGCAVVFNGWFILVHSNAVGMFTVNSALFAVIGAFSAVDLLREKRPDLKPGCRLLGVLFALFAGFMALRAAIRPFLENGTGVLPQVTLIDTLAALVALAAAILWAVGFLWTVYGASEYRLRRANADLERFTGTVAHDLKAPLSSITGFLGILKRSPKAMDPEKSQEYLGLANDAAWRMNEIIDDLLDQATNANHQQLFARVDANCCSRDAIKNLQFQIKRLGGTLSVQDLPVVWGNKTQITRLFQNLYDNAIKYQDPAQALEINVNATCQDEIVTFAVADNGIGVPDGANDRIFDYMQRVGDTETVSGVGLGLSECRRIVENHGGVIWLDPASNGGSTFYFTMRRSNPKT